jgi:hypothetical protein
MKIGLVHTRGLGDIVVALPIAQWFLRQKHEVYWPIDRRFIPHFVDHCPEINWLPVEPDKPDSRPNGKTDGSPRYFLQEPMDLLRKAACERVHVLYHRILLDPNLGPLSQALHFDQMKYALSDVPFSEKWNLRNCIRRFPRRERELFTEMVPQKPYALVHLEASDQEAPFESAADYCEGLPIVQIKEDPRWTIFDWLSVIEGASRIVMIDSVFSNIVDQLGLTTRKLFIIKHSGWQPPVMRMHWHYGWNKPQNMGQVIPEVDNGLLTPEVPGSLDRAASDKTNS